ncbi:MAG: SDR family NAD(P)-dependent oxidoreductase [Lentisphaeria bacterium]|nr:SDR family NAD(P)-dependent oxidoreductase [Lentisphaeria bacterium]
MSLPGTELSVDGMVAVVTGAAQGLGVAIAEQLAAAGATVTLADLQLEKIQSVADSLCQAGSTAAAIRLDVTDSGQVDDVMAQVTDAHGRLDILVNSAGLGQKVVPTVELSDDEWQRVLDVNITGTFNCCRAAGRQMERQESGAIVNIASMNGHNPSALVASYNVSKAGVISLTRTLAMELAAYGVRVNAVSPGPVYTEFNKKVMAQRCLSLNLTEDEMIERIRTAVPLGRWGEPTDIAATVAFLCSDAASWVTGEVWRVSGGLEGISVAPPKRER